jgi:SET domain-containing protein
MRAALHTELQDARKEAQVVAGTQPFVVKRSRIEGRGAFATQRIRTGQKIGEYAGERITHAESDIRYENIHSRTYLFIVDSKIVIDADVDGNDVRFINHSCDPNCESRMDAKKRVFIYATRMIEPGEELAYDYRLALNPGEDLMKEIPDFPCHCGSEKCRGTLLWIPYKQRKAAAALLARVNGHKSSTNGHKSVKSKRRARVR